MNRGEVVARLLAPCRCGHPGLGCTCYLERRAELMDREPPPVRTATVILFKPNGKYYTEEQWRLPTREQAEQHSGFLPGDMVCPYQMRYSPDFRRIDGGPVLVDTQEPWGYPHLLV